MPTKKASKIREESQEPAENNVRQTTVEASTNQAVIVQAPDFKNVYINFAQTQVSPFDIALTMGEMVGISPDGKPMIQSKVRVAMSAVEAKLLSMLLTGALKGYEEQFGKIEIPSGLFASKEGV